MVEDGRRYEGQRARKRWRLVRLVIYKRGEGRSRCHRGVGRVSVVTLQLTLGARGDGVLDRVCAGQGKRTLYRTGEPVQQDEREGGGGVEAGQGCLSRWGAPCLIRGV